VNENKPIVVAIALVWRDGKLLVSRRRKGQHLAGFWEFPGGKLKGAENIQRCAEREVLEEVGVVVRAERERPIITYEYADRVVELHPVDCSFDRGEPVPRQVDEVRWVEPAELVGLQFPPANALLIAELLEDRGR
jgi:mutator protein MutT